VVEDSVTIHVTMAPVNSPPEAVIDGPTVKVRPGDDVVLDGSRSSDRDGVIVTFDWSCISHPTLEFNGQNTSFITFTVEDVGDYTFTLTVVDNLGTDCDEPAYHTVYVKTNVLPVANVTGPMMGLPGINYTLSAATSSDEDGEVVQWKWNCTSHPDLNITGVENETMTFNPPAADDYVFRLVVWDDEGATSQATEWTVEINPIDEPPKADAGVDKQVRIGGSVELSGAASNDYEGEIVAWLWKCTSHTNVPGLVNADQMLASFTPPDPGTFVFSLEVQDEAGQWSEPDSIIITVLEENSAPEVTVISPTTGSLVTLDQHMLVIRWDTYDANGDTIMFKVEIWKVDDGEVFLARKGNLPYGTNNVTFNATNFNFPRGVDLEARILAWETNTEDGYTANEVAGPFQIKKDQPVQTNGGGDDDEGLGLNYILIGVVVLLALLLVGWMIMRGGSEDDEVPWEDEASEAPRSTARSALAEHMPTAPSRPGPQTLPAAEAASQTKGATKTDPKGRLLDCPECGAPLDHDTDFGAPYCWDCDKYF
jgi:hypothetical protein